MKILQIEYDKSIAILHYLNDNYRRSEGYLTDENEKFLTNEKNSIKSANKGIARNGDISSTTSEPLFVEVEDKYETFGSKRFNITKIKAPRQKNNLFVSPILFYSSSSFLNKSHRQGLKLV